MAKVQFKYGTWAKYSALSQKDENTLYFITDKNLFFKGSTAFGNIVSATATDSGETEGETITFNAADGTEVSFTVPTAAALAAVKSALAGSLTTHTNVKGTSGVFGHVKLSDNTNSTSAAAAGIARPRRPSRTHSRRRRATPTAFSRPTTRWCSRARSATRRATPR